MVRLLGMEVGWLMVSAVDIVVDADPDEEVEADEDDVAAAAGVLSR